MKKFEVFTSNCRNHNVYFQFFPRKFCKLRKTCVLKVQICLPSEVWADSVFWAWDNLPNLQFWLPWPQERCQSWLQCTEAWPAKVTFSKLCKITKLICFSIVDNEIDDFLKEEIKAEEQNLKQLVDISGFVVKQEGAELTFTKTHGSEK